MAQVQAKPFTMETIAGFSVTSGTRISKGETQHIALLSAGQETWSLAVTGKNADRVLRQVLSTLRSVKASDAALAPQRIRIRTPSRSGVFESIAAECCGPSAAMDILSALNGLRPGEEVPAGRRIKCVGR